MTQKKKKMHWIVFLLVLAAVMSVSVWQSLADKAADDSAETAEGQVLQDLTAEESRALIKEHEDDEDFVILDVRTADEFKQAHIENAENLDFYAKTFREQLDKLEKDKTYLVYCRTGRRSGLTLQLMKKLNFTHAYNMQGGIVTWATKKLPLTK